MSGMAQILDENTALREQSRQLSATVEAQGRQLEAQAEQLGKQSRQLEAQGEQNRQIEELRGKLKLLLSENQHLTKHLEFLAKKRELARAERFIADEAQGVLFEDAEVKLPPRDGKVEDADKAAGPKKDKRKNPKHRRRGRRRPEDFNFRKRVVHVPLEHPDKDPSGWEELEPRVSFRIAWMPGEFVLEEVRRERWHKVGTPKNEVWTADEPYLLPGAMCDDSLLARLIVDRFGDHLPFNRQAKRMGREGFSVGTNVLAGWARQGFHHVRPLIKAITEQVSSTDTTLQSDDTGFSVQDGGDGKLANGRLWVFTDQQQAFFGFSRTKEGERPAELLESLGVEGVCFVADGGSEYNEVVKRLGLQRGGCWSHLRRYFHEAAIQHDEANVALVSIRDLFLIERDLVTVSPEERLAERQRRALPVVDGLFAWARGMVPKVRPKSKLARAIGYAIRQQDRLRLFLEHAHVPIHNNLSELLLRQPVVGRKNWLFARSEGGAEAAAGWFTIIASCLLQGIDPQAYLYDVFRRLPDHPSNRVHELTPLRWRIAVDDGELTPLSPGQLT